MNRKAIYTFVAATTAVFVVSAPLRASEADDGIESSFKQTYVYKTYLSGDSVKADAENGVVTLTGTVADESHKALAQETATSLPGVMGGSRSRVGWGLLRMGNGYDNDWFTGSIPGSST